MGRGRGPALIVADTHAWLWWQNGSDVLSQQALSALGRGGPVGVSAISCWELTMLEQRGRIRFDRGASAWLRQALADDRTELLPISAEIAIRAGQLHGRIPEPADALIYATALELDATLVTRDRLLHELDPERAVW